MADLLKSLTKGWGLPLYVWMFPCALFVGAFWLFIYPEVQGLDILGDFAALTTAEKGGLTGAVVVFLGLTMMSLSTPLYRLLEGYSWPKCLRDLGVECQREKKKALKEAQEGEGWERGLLLEKLSRFPLDDKQIVPTRLGNAIRAFETYGKTRFNLDSQTMWSELCAVVPEYLQKELDLSRAGVDIFIALYYSSALFGLMAFLALFHTGWSNLPLWISGIAAIALMVFWYQMAVVASRYWSATVQALVNLGRKDLAESMGLELPKKIDKEREMWGVVTKFVFYGHAKTTGSKLDKFRKS